MPTYVYKFTDTGETIEVQQAFTDDALIEAVHPTTGATMEVKKVFLPVGVTFRGGGFYKNDSRGPGAKSKSTNGDTSSDTSSDKASDKASDKSTGDKSTNDTSTSDKSASSTSTSTESSSSSTKTPAASTPAASSSSSD